MARIASRFILWLKLSVIGLIKGLIFLRLRSIWTSGAITYGSCVGLAIIFLLMRDFGVVALLCNWVGPVSIRIIYYFLGQHFFFPFLAFFLREEIGLLARELTFFYTSLVNSEKVTSIDEDIPRGFDLFLRVLGTSTFSIDMVGKLMICIVNCLTFRAKL